MIEVWSNWKNGGQLQLKFGPNRKKEADHTCGWVQNGKRRLTTPVVWFKMEKGGRPHLWFGSNQEKEADHTRSFVENEYLAPLFRKNELQLRTSSG